MGYKQRIDGVVRLLDRWLLNDLNRLEAVGHSPEPGRCTIPMAQTIMAGMELVGMLASGEEDEKAFRFFWDEYLSVLFPEYKNEKLCRIFRELLRNGMAHVYFMKPGVGLSFDPGEKHLDIVNRGKNKGITIHLPTLHSHFLACFNCFKNDWDRFKSNKTLQRKLNFKKGWGVFVAENQKHWKNKISAYAKSVGK
jgi:hypothetical protein